MISDEQRFVWDVESLREIVRNPSPRNLIDSTVPLRRLLMDDGEALVVKVARKCGMKVQFNVLTSSNRDGFQSIIDGLPVKRGLSMIYMNPNPSIYPNAVRENVDLGRFLSTPTTYLDGSKITINTSARGP
jgi:hypothetical protein